MSKSKSAADRVIPWLRANLGNQCTAPLTGTDARALAAAVQVAELYSYCPTVTVATAFRYVVTEMQTTTRELAYHSIAMVMDWSDRDRLWTAAELTPILNPRRCLGE